MNLYSNFAKDLLIMVVLSKGQGMDEKILPT